MTANQSKPARPALVYSPLTVSQAFVVRILLPQGRMLAIVPPKSGRVALDNGAQVTVKYATFQRLMQLGALERVPYGERQEYYALSDTGRALWDEHCRIEGTPSYDHRIDGSMADRRS